MRAEERLILALDVDSLEQAQEITRELGDYITIYKIGSRLFTAGGPESVRTIKDVGGKVFLDLKLHDIPNTVAKTAAQITRLGVDMYDVHALGGKEMMVAAMDGSQHVVEESGQKRPLALGVTVLTHLKNGIIRQELGIDKSIEEEVLHLAQLVAEAGLDGVICSPKEIAVIREKFGDKLLIVTPGIRPLWADPGEQRRALSPGEAIEAGADYLVIGRPITEAVDRREAVERILSEME